VRPDPVSRRTEARRTCVGCRAVRAQSRLIRLEAADSGGVLLNPRRRRARGAYLCPAPPCLERALARGALSRALRRAGRELEPAGLRRAFAVELSRLGLPASAGEATLGDLG
jgi:uncharacterized protein